VPMRMHLRGEDSFATKIPHKCVILVLRAVSALLRFPLCRLASLNMQRFVRYTVAASKNTTRKFIAELCAVFAL
jgi:hypothetical protein